MQAFAVGEIQTLVHNSSGNTGQSLTELFDNGNRTPKASELIDWAVDQGWTQRPGPGPRTFVDQNGRVRLKIKVAVQSPGVNADSHVPHVEAFDATGQRIDPHTGLPSGKRQPGNHRPIDFDLDPS
jgi:hypothetical protein